MSVERRRQLTKSGARLGSARAAAFRRRRELRAAELGFADLVDYYERRYRDERRSLDEPRRRGFGSAGKTRRRSRISAAG
jgi:hypothetical protein